MVRCIVPEIGEIAYGLLRLGLGGECCAQYALTERPLAANPSICCRQNATLSACSSFVIAIPPCEPQCRITPRRKQKKVRWLDAYAAAAVPSRLRLLRAARNRAAGFLTFMM